MNTPFVMGDFQLQAHKETRIGILNRKKEFAESEKGHNPPSPGENVIQHNDYRCNAGGQQKRGLDRLPKERGSILKTGPAIFFARIS